jgi:outer membrane protein assembly factor BamA
MDYTCFGKMANLVLYRLMAVMIGCLLTITSFAQLRLQIVPAVNEIQSRDFKRNFKSRQELFNYLQQLPSILQGEGYLSASIDSIAEKDTVIIAWLFLGPQYHWQELRIKPEDRLLLEQLGYTTFTIADAPVISSLPKKIIDHYQDRGYPFAKVKWDSIHLDNDRISASLLIDKGAVYKLDSISLQGPVKISKNFLLRYLDIPADSIYNRSVLDKIDQKLIALPFIIQVQPWSITMHTTGYTLNFYLQPKKSNQVDALIGFLPSSQQNGDKLLLTVDAKVLLRNAFGSGETIDFNWEQIQPKSPRLHLLYQQPYIFHSEFGADLSFDLYKKDSSFLNIHGSLGLQYDMKQYRSFKIMLQVQRTNLLDVDTNNIKLTKQLPDIVDLANVGIGIAYSFNNTDYRLNPRKGSEITLSSLVNKKTIRRNNAITQIKDGSFNYDRLYDSIDLNSYQLRLSLLAAHYFPMARRSVLKTALNAGLLQTPDYFRNEMFQVGGYRLLRGFDEESIFTNRYAVATLEYRYIVNLNSYFFGFTDAGYTNFKSAKESFSHTYLGVGAGMAFQTKQGIFNISYAVGKRDDLQFNLRQSKIHLGYTSFF